MFLVKFKNGREEFLDSIQMSCFLLVNHCALSYADVVHFLNMMICGSVLYFDGEDNFNGEFECFYFGKKE